MVLDGYPGELHQHEHDKTDHTGRRLLDVHRLSMLHFTEYTHRRSLDCKAIKLFFGMRIIHQFLHRNTAPCTLAGFQRFVILMCYQFRSDCSLHWLLLSGLSLQDNFGLTGALSSQQCWVLMDLTHVPCLICCPQWLR